MRLNQVRYPVRDNSGLSASCSSEQEQRSVNVLHSFALLRI